MTVHRRPIRGGSAGPRNWFGNGDLGHVRITAAGGAEQSFDGVVWTTIPDWTVVGSVVMVPSIQDGDLVVLNCRTYIDEAGLTLTTTNRCRGLVLYTRGACTVAGTLSMTARGCRANPADATTSTDTPVAPTDGHAVPAGGIVLRRFAAGHTDTNADENLFHGCGAAMVASEANQPPVDGDGLVITIPRVGGSGGAGVHDNVAGAGAGQTAANAPGGGGGANGDTFAGGPGAAGTCFSGGAGGGAADQLSVGGAGVAYGGPGGDAIHLNESILGSGAGNPAGAGYGGGDAEDGTGGLLIIIAGGLLTFTGRIEAEGSDGGDGFYAGGGSGGGVVVILHAGEIVNTGTVSVAGGAKGENTNPSYNYDGGPGGAGAVIGPFKIDPA